jgi:hypothetical protein
MQQASDRQKMLQQYGILMSDPRLPTVVTRLEDIESLEGRVLAHVHDDMTGRPQMILEGTDGKVHFIRHAPEMEQLRADWHLAQNAFVSFTKNGDVVLVRDFGDAHAYLGSGYLRDVSRRQLQRGVIPKEAEYGGWLGQYHRALANPSPGTEPGIERNRSAVPGEGKSRGPSRAR